MGKDLSQTYATAANLPAVFRALDRGRHLATPEQAFKQALDSFRELRQMKMRRRVKNWTRSTLVNNSSA
jgi:hypothetical protein